MTTPHIAAPAGAFAPSVLMPGDPMRARFIAERLLENSELISAVRGNEAYTGTFGGVPVSVMASGMGMPSTALYATELFRFYQVERIIRVGTCGGVQADLSLGDIVVGEQAQTDGGIPAMFGYPPQGLRPDPNLLSAVRAASVALPLPIRTGIVHSSDLFYYPDPDALPALGRGGVLAVEMEAAALYAVARYQNKEALAVLTVSDVIGREESFSPIQREQGIVDMVRLALVAIEEL